MSNDAQKDISFQIAIDRARTRFAHGRFELLCGQSINDVVEEANVPEAHGIYVIFSCDDLERPLYIGKAGTVKTDGSFKAQTLAVRLTNQQCGKSRRKFFGELMKEKYPAGLTFLWFVTHDKDSRIIPALAETELLQAHYEQYKCLPELN